MYLDSLQAGLYSLYLGFDFSLLVHAHDVFRYRLYHAIVIIVDDYQHDTRVRRETREHFVQLSITPARKPPKPHY